MDLEDMEKPKCEWSGSSIARSGRLELCKGTDNSRKLELMSERENTKPIRLRPKVKGVESDHVRLCVNTLKPK
jgi:hypothetical protein